MLGSFVDREFLINGSYRNDPTDSVVISYATNKDEEATEKDEMIQAKDDEISDEIWDDLEFGGPGKWSVLSQMLGVNIFTYILAAMIVLFLSVNAILGPGWLGQRMGLEGTGTFTQISDSLPDSIDLSGPDNLL